DGKPYTLIDTAGIRRRGKTAEMVEKFSVIKTMQAIADANVVVLVLDPIQGITEQDSHIAGFALEQGRALVVAFNKWDATDAEQRERAKQEFERRMYFLDFAETLLVSARAKSGLKGLLAACRAAYESAMMKMPTPMLTRALQAAIAQQQPARQGQSRPKMRYAHQGGQNPPLIIIHGNSLDKIPATYKRFLEHYFRKAFGLKGTPLRIEFKSAENPYKNT
ncbi:MAG: GTP-binding protein, partial [Pseudomonadota bacterium]